MAGHWITIDGHHVLIEDDKKGPPGPHSSDAGKGKPHLEPLNAWGQTPKVAKQVRKQIREAKKTARLQKMISKRGYGFP